MSETIGILELFRIVKKKWYILVITAVLGLVSGFAITEYFISPQFSSATKLLVSRPQSGDQSLDLGEIQTNIQMINTYRDVIQDAVVLDKVSTKMNSQLTQQDLAEKIEVLIQEDSQIFGIQVVDTDPHRAALIANNVATTFSDNIGGIINVENVAILSPAIPDEVPVSPNLLFNMVISAFAGILLGLSIIMIWTILDTKVHDESIIREELNWINLGSVTSMNKTLKRSNNSNDDTNTNLETRRKEGMINNPNRSQLL